ncbi:MAG: hypothetical protein ACHRHE_15305, partial [Tepidisphaerales bacterium]
QIPMQFAERAAQSGWHRRNELRLDESQDLRQELMPAVALGTQHHQPGEVGGDSGDSGVGSQTPPQ